MADHRAAQHGAGHPHDKHDALDLGEPQQRRAADRRPPDEPDDAERATDADAGTEDDPAAG